MLVHEVFIFTRFSVLARKITGLSKSIFWPDLGPNCLQRLSADDISR